jgi:molybdopterin converting factor subunit 1
MNQVNILFFASLKEKVGKDKLALEIPEETTVAGLKDLLFQKYPELPKSKANLIVAVNKEFSFEQDEIPQHAEIAIFPPVSGG